MVIPNNGIVDISDIGSENDDALHCNTNRPPPRGGPNNSGGDWFIPDGTKIYPAVVPGFQTNRGPMVARLLRKPGVPAEGMYKCSIKDVSMLHTVFIGIYTSGNG